MNTLRESGTGIDLRRMIDNMNVEQEVTKFRREHFIRIDLDKEHYYYSFGVPGFEICLEPCAAGFDVAIYAEDMAIGSDFKSSEEPKQCTKTGDYTQIDALFGDRKDEDWNRALAIADDLLEKYIKDREKLPDEELVPDSEDLQGREKLLESVKKIRQILREEGLSKSQAHSVLAFAVRSLLLRWP